MTYDEAVAFAASVETNPDVSANAKACIVLLMNYINTVKVDIPQVADEFSKKLVTLTEVIEKRIEAYETIEKHSGSMETIKKYEIGTDESSLSTAKQKNPA